MDRLGARLRKLGRLVLRSDYRRGLRHGVAAAIEHEAVLRSLTLASLIDVGANVGQFALVARVAHPGLRIEAFEPLAEPAAVFRRLFAGDPAVRLHETAAGEAAASATIHISGRRDSSSLLPISDRQTRLFPGTQEVDSRTIEVRRIDEVLEPTGLARPLMVKLDVQGYELAALKGMTKILAHSDLIYCEVSYQELYSNQPLADELTAWLGEQGFRLRSRHNLSRDGDGRPIQADLLFERA